MFNINQINTCNILPFFSKFRGLITEKSPLFLDFVNSRLQLKKYPPFREKEYEHGIRFGWECVCVVFCDYNYFISIETPFRFLLRVSLEIIYSVTEL